MHRICETHREIDMIAFLGFQHEYNYIVLKVYTTLKEYFDSKVRNIPFSDAFCCF